MNMELEIRMEDKTDSDRELKHYWSECIGAGRAKEQTGSSNFPKR